MQVLLISLLYIYKNLSGNMYFCPVFVTMTAGSAQNAEIGRNSYIYKVEGMAVLSRCGM